MYKNMVTFLIGIYLGVIFRYNVDKIRRIWLWNMKR